MTPQQCPTQADLSAYQLGDLPQQQAAALERHLEACPRCAAALRQLDELADGVLDALRRFPPPEVTHTCPTAPSSPAREPQPPRSPPGYEVLGEIGRGGMGVVYRARQVGLDRTVALKMVLSGIHAGSEKLARFLAEGQLAARLDHPHIVRVYEVGTHQGHPFMVLEYVPGSTLAGHFRGRPWALVPPRQTAALLEQLSQAVDHAHRQGIIHRDLKPANVLVSPDGTPKITDFGLAKSLTNHSPLTATGDVMGTPSYMAPEQAEGKKEVGPAADVYALGGILYECLTGRPPFQADTPMLTLLQVVQDDPLPVRLLRPEVPRDLETICHKCLSKSPAGRYASALELAEDLGRFLRGEPVRARPVGRVERGWSWARRHPAWSAAYALAALVAVLGLLGAGAGVMWRRAEAERATADELRGKAEQGQRKLEALQDLLQQVLSLQQVQIAQREWLAGDYMRARHLLAACPEERRGWEWGYVDRLSRPPLELKEPTGPVGSVAFSPDGTRIVSGGALYDALRVWDLQGRLLCTLEGTEPPKHRVRTTGASMQVAFSPDGTQVVSSLGKYPVILWDAVTGRRVGTLRGKTPTGVGCLAYSPDGKLLAVTPAGSNVRDSRIFLWEAQTGQEVRILRGHAGQVRDVAFSRDGCWMASCCAGGEVLLWDTQTWKGTRILQRKGEWLSYVAFSPDGKRVVSASKARVTAQGVLDGRQVFSVEGLGGVSALRYSPAGPFALGLADGTISVRDGLSGTELFRLRGHGTGAGGLRGITGLAYSPDGKALASAGYDQTVKVWDATRPQDHLDIRVGEGPGTVLDLAPGCARLLCHTDGRRAQVWDADSGKLLGSVGDAQMGALGALSADGGTVALVGTNRGVHVIDVSTGRPLAALPPPPGQVPALVFSPDGTRLAVLSVQTGKGAHASVWDWRAGREVLTLPFPNGWLSRVAFSPDGTRLALGLPEEVQVRDLATGEQLSSWRQQRGVGQLAFAPRGDLLASAGDDGVIRVWQVGRPGEVLALEGHGPGLYGLAFSPDGKRLASAGTDGSVRLWDLVSGQEAFRLPLPGAQQVRFSADGARLYATTQAGLVVRRWDGSPARPLPGGE